MGKIFVVLCCGPNHSFENGLRRRFPGCRIISVDWDPKCGATYCVDLNEWDFVTALRHLVGRVDAVFAMPECSAVSKANTRKDPAKIALAVQLSKTIFRIIKFLQCRVFVLENPATGLLPLLMDEIEQDLPWYEAHYCAYGFPCRKATAFFSSVPLSLEVCGGGGECPQMVLGESGHWKHVGSVGNAHAEYSGGHSMTLTEKNLIPARLIDSIIAQLFP